MTDTLILDAMMEALRRNPLSKERLDHPEAPLGSENSQFVQTDARPAYARREVGPSSSLNRRYVEAVDPFHADLTATRLERPRRGSCGNLRTIQREMDGKTWTSTEPCRGIVHAVETRIAGAVRVDGKCLTCGWEVHRAGVLKEG